MKSKQKKLIYILMVGLIISLLNINIINFQVLNLKNDEKIEEYSQFNLKNSGYWELINTTILIDNTAPYWSGSINWTTLTLQPWCSGSGTAGDPYIIENLTMIGYEYQACFWIQDSNVPLIIRNCTFIDTPAAMDLWDVNDARIFNNTFINSGNGIGLSSCENVTIFENDFIGGYTGIDFNGGFDNRVLNNRFYDTRTGLAIINDAYDNLIYQNIFQDNYLYAIDLWAGENNNFSENIMNGCGFYFDYEPARAETNIIEPTNLVDGKPLYYYIDKLNLIPQNFTGAGQVIIIRCNNSQISNLNITNCRYGITMILCKNNTLNDSNCSNGAIFLRECNNITLNNNIVSDFDSAGIYISSGKRYNLANNQLFNSGLGIGGEVKDMFSNNIDTSNLVNNKPLYYLVNKTGLESSTISDAGQLILVDCEDSLIRDFEFSNCYIGITAYNCKNNTFSNITSHNNHNGIYFDNCSYNKILNCNVSNCSAYGIQFYIGTNNTIRGSTISKCYYSAILLYGEENRLIENTVIWNTIYGMYIGGQNNNITNNDIFNNGGYGLNLGGNFNLVGNNNISNNNKYGINLFGSSYNTIFQNVISNNRDHGIYLEGANDNTISRNEIIENDRSGVFIFRWCDNNDVIGNDIKRNDEFGIFLHDDTNFNTIYSNNFTSNLVNAEDDGILNVWDNGTKGNYWDDYFGVDDDDDGIGDTPYIDIGGNAGTQDDLPIWWDPPAFSIVSPIENQNLGGEAPAFIIEIDAGVPKFMWYTLGSSLIKYFFITNSTINQGAWDTISSDTVTITFFINDSAGKIISNDVTVRLDKVIPIIIINLPHQNEEFGETAPLFNIIAIDDFLDDIWYTLNDGITNHSCGISGQIDQTLWDILPGGTYTLRFYASDTNGNIGYSQVTIIKTSESIIPGFDILIVFFTVLITLVSTTWFLRNKSKLIIEN